MADSLQSQHAMFGDFPREVNPSKMNAVYL